MMAGFFAGYGAWLSNQNGVPWAFGDNFLATLFRCGVFSSLFMGFISAFTSYSSEKKLHWAFQKFASASALGFAFGSLAAVIYSILLGSGLFFSAAAYTLKRVAWWILLASALSIARGYLYESWASAVWSLAGLVPGFVFAGLFADFACFPAQRLFAGSLIISMGSALSLAVALELFKESWLEKQEKGLFVSQIIFEKDDMVIGSADDCDYIIGEECCNNISISERDGVHVLEVIDGAPVRVNKAKVRYHCLVEGDVIYFGTEPWIYRNRYARERDILPEGAVGG
ncbi:MAG: hypothetical protein HQM10_18120 [Candidatus Riflebacteria bacterium]|nr:hypothetical protein [Candidatus Riflebacteria bacterium]